MYDNISHAILNIDVKMTSLIQEFKKFMAPLNSTSQVQSTPENQVPAQTQQQIPNLNKMWIWAMIL